MNRNGKPAIAVVSVLVVLLVIYNSMFTVNERELAVVTEFGKPVDEIKESGLYFRIPLIQDVRRLPKTKQFWASGPNDVLVDLPTRDGKKVEISLWAIWEITEPKRFVQIMQTVDNAEQQVVQRVRAGVRDVITSYDLAEVVRSSDRELTYSFGLEASEIENAEDEAENLSQVGEQAVIRVGREKIMAEILSNIERQLKEGADDESQNGRGIRLVDVGVSNIGFVQSVRQAAFERLKAFMEAIAARYHNEGEQRKQEIINETNAEVEKILGEGEEQSKRLRGEVEAEIIESYAKAIRATGDFYNFQRTLEVYESALDTDTRLILTTDSDLFRMLKQIGDAKPRSTGSGEPTESSADNE
ncbi:MAG: protease modulator HflC [Fuerstiella sp.]